MQTIESLPEFQSLNTKRQSIARAVASGQSFNAAAKAVGLNGSREKRNLQLQRCLWKHKTQLDPVTGDALFGKPSAGEDGELDIYEKVRRLEWLTGDNIEPPSPDVENVMWVLPDEDRAFWASLGHEVTELPARPEPAPAEVIARWKAQWKAKWAADDLAERTAFLESHPCAGCSREATNIRGVHAFCAQCVDAPAKPTPMPAAAIYPVADHDPVLGVKRCQKCGAIATMRAIVCEVPGCHATVR